MKKSYSIISNSMYLLKGAWKFEKKIVLAMCLEIFFSVITPFIGILLPAKVIAELGQTHSIQTFAISILGIFVLYTFIQFGKDYFVTRNLLGYINMRVKVWLNDVVFGPLDVDYEKSETKEFKESLEKAWKAIGNNRQGVEGFFHNFTKFMSATLGLALYLILLSNVNIYIVVILFGLSLVSFVIYYFCKKKYNQMKDQISENYVHVRYFNELAFDVNQGKDIRLFSLHKHLSKLANLAISKDRKLSRQREGYMYYYYVSIEVLACIRDFVCYGYLIHLLINQGLSISEFVLYLGMVNGISGQFMEISANASLLMLDSDYVNDYRCWFDENREKDKATMASDEVFDVVFDHVTYQYPGNERKILDDFNLHLKKGEKLALVGLNGAGKTTLVKLLCGLYHPTSGRILINGVNLEEINRKDYFQSIGALFQDSKVFSFTIGENVSGLHEGAYDEERVIDCLKQAGLYDKVQTFPKGIKQYVNKDVEEDGINLSGGQYQRLFLARVLYKNPKLLLMDEPTAALDAISEQEMYEKYNEITNEVTSVFISHRLASTRFCDRIILLEDGKISEMGTHEELMNQKGAYYDLFEVQSKYYKEGGNENVESL